MSETITSRQNPRVKLAGKLRERRGREEQGRIIIDGVREITRAAQAGVEIVEAFVCETTLSAAGRQLITQLVGAVEMLFVTEPIFEKIGFGNRAEGIVAVARPPVRELSEIELSEHALVAVLEGLEKPGNVGAVLRSADASGVAAVIAVDPGTDLFNPNTIRASAGTIFTLPFVSTNHAALGEWLRESAFRLLATRVDGAIDYSDATYTGRTAIILGSEARGLSAAWSADDVSSIKLPMLGVADSLNVSVTAAVLFYEALRQRRAIEAG